MWINRSYPLSEAHKLSPCIYTWKLKDPANVSKFQPAFKVKKITAAAAVATATGADADTSNRVVSLVKAEGPSARCCHWSLRYLQEPPVEIRKKVDEAMHGSWREAWRRRPRGQTLPTLIPTLWQIMPSVWQRLGQRKRNSPNITRWWWYLRIAKQKDHTNQDGVGENWVRKYAGELALTKNDKMKAWVEHFARLLDVEFQWPGGELPVVPLTAGHRWNAVKLLVCLASELRC